MNDKDIHISLTENGTNIKHSIPYEITRKVMKSEELEKFTGFERHKNSFFQSIKSSIESIKFKTLIFNLIPILDWLPKYKIKSFLIGDVIAGITVSILAIPQGMAYGLLAGLDPVAGLYMAFFPVLIYFIFGSSRHVSVGTFAIVSIMTSKVVATYSDPNYGTSEAYKENSFSNYQVATAATLACGIFHLGMFVLQLGVVASLLSEALVSGFTTGSAIHVVITQTKDLLGISFPRHKGAFKAILSVKDIILQIPHANLYTVYVSVSCMIFLIIVNEILRPIVAKKTKLPIPAELIAVIVYTAVSYLMNFNENYKIDIVGKIPTGLPTPQFPPLNLVYMVAVDSIAITVVSYSIVVSMGLICAKKDKTYEVRPNQELLALGAANVFGSCFSCIPLACALSRTMVLYQLGGKTQIVSVVSALIILMLLLWLGPLFETLPRSILAAIIIVALKSMLWQFKDIKKYYKESKLDALVWLGTFCTVVIIDIDIGLLVGFILSLFTLYMKGFKSYSCMLGQVTGTEIYVDLKSHKNIKEIPGVKIFKYFGSINFATCSNFKKNLFENLNIDCHKIKAASHFDEKELNDRMKTLIIDLSAVAHLDVRGYRMILEIKNELKAMDINVLLACVSDVVYTSIQRAVNIGDGEIEIFPTIHDAILFSEKKFE